MDDKSKTTSSWSKSSPTRSIGRMVAQLYRGAGEAICPGHDSRPALDIQMLDQEEA